MNKKKAPTPARDLPARQGSESPAALFAELDSELLLEAAAEMENCFTLANLELPTQPLVYVNPAFCATIGYSLSEVKGRNARFLQGPLSSREAITAIRLAIQARQAIFQDLINYKKSGLPFWNRMILLPIVLKQGGMHYIGLQNDVTDLKKRQGFEFSDPSPSLIAQLELRDSLINPLTVLLLHYQLVSDAGDDTSMRLIFREKITRALRRLIYVITTVDSPSISTPPLS